MVSRAPLLLTPLSLEEQLRGAKVIPALLPQTPLDPQSLERQLRRVRMSFALPQAPLTFHGLQRHPARLPGVRSGSAHSMAWWIS